MNDSRAKPWRLFRIVVPIFFFRETRIGGRGIDGDQRHADLTLTQFTYGWELFTADHRWIPPHPDSILATACCTLF